MHIIFKYTQQIKIEKINYNYITRARYIIFNQ